MDGIDSQAAQGLFVAFPIAGLLAGYAMEQFEHEIRFDRRLAPFRWPIHHTRSRPILYRAIIPVEESMLASVERLLPGLFIKTAFGGLALVDSALGRCPPSNPET